MSRSMRPISTEETYRRLKHKVSYSEACVIYTVIMMEFPSTTPRDVLNDAAEEDLAKVGWTIDELMEESFIQEKFNHFESKYG